MTSPVVRNIELLESKIDDIYVREAIRRIRLQLQGIQNESSSGSGGDSTTVVNESVWSTFTDNISASSSKTVDQIDLDLFFCVKYIICVRNEADNKTTFTEIVVKNQDGDIEDSIPTHLSGGIDYYLDAVNDSGYMKLNLTNNELSEVNIEVAKLAF